MKILRTTFWLLLSFAIAAPLVAAHADTPSVTLDASKSSGKADVLKSFKDGLKYYDIKVGKGVSPAAGQTVSVLYTGSLLNGQVFDSTSMHGDQPIDFQIGVGQVIAGWDEGVIGNKLIAGMKVGGIRHLVIPGNLAYGANPPPGAPIPANATLVFDITLVAVK